MRIFALRPFEETVRTTAGGLAAATFALSASVALAQSGNSAGGNSKAGGLAASQTYWRIKERFND